MPTATLNPDFDAGVRHSGTTNWNTPLLPPDFTCSTKYLISEVNPLIYP